MRPNPALIGLIVVALLAVSCGADLDIDIGVDTIDGSGDLVTTTFDVDEFDRIEVSHAFEADIIVGPGGPSVEVESDENLVDDLRVMAENGTLEIGIRSGSFRFTELRATIVVPDLRSIEASGAASVVVEGVSGDRFTANVSGASSLEVDGSVDELEVDASGASEVDLEGLEAGDVEIDASGASSVEVRASESVTGDASGASSVVVKGDASVDVDTSGASSVEVD
ncbi:MAG: DUF2807 domain-containing protein [Actinomycetia bacterium]|nr:DUF2807 domain-containing protein [Actinomycetes bacterium]